VTSNRFALILQSILSTHAGQHPKPQHWVPTPKGKPYSDKAQ